MFAGRNFESPLHIYGSSKTNDNNQSSSQVLRDSYNTTGNHHPYTGEGSSTSSSSQQTSSHQDDSSRGSMAQRRRSHRPRGCRGGRKNRKNREAKAARGEELVPSTTSDSILMPRIGPPPHNKPVSESALSEHQGDLPSYHQPVAARVGTSTNAWAQRSPSILPPPSVTTSTQQQDTTRKMLPPPLPPFVNGNDPFVAKEAKDISKFLKMLPSFEEEPEQQPSQDAFVEASSSLEKLWEQPMRSAISSSSSSSSGDEAGSLFVTSPRSFLMGNLVPAEGFPRSQFSLW